MKTIILDVDGTILKGQSQKYFIEYLYKKKLISIFIFIKIMSWFFLYKLNLLDNPQIILEYALSKTVKDKDKAYVKEITHNFFISKLKKKIFKDALTLIQENKENGVIIILTSNTLDIILKEIASYLNINFFIGTTLEIKDNIYTGKIKGKINYGKNKVTLLKKFLKKEKISLSSSCGYGDHLSDIFMLNLVKYPFVINPNKKMKKEAEKRNWKILNFK